VRLRRTATALIAAVLLSVTTLLPLPAAAKTSTQAPTPPTSNAPSGLVRVTGKVPAPPPAPRTNLGTLAVGGWQGPYTFRNFKSGKCLTIYRSSVTAGFPAVQYTCVADTISQMWWLWVDGFHDFGAEYLFGNASSGLCLEAQPGLNEVVFQTQCYTGVRAQIWGTNSTTYPNRYYNGESAAPNIHVMEVQGAQLVNNAKIITWNSTGKAQQVWLRYGA
jgi:ricin-type beta-trefoil lectin protein